MGLAMGLVMGLEMDFVLVFYLGLVLVIYLGGVMVFYLGMVGLQVGFALVFAGFAGFAPAFAPSLSAPSLPLG